MSKIKQEKSSSQSFLKGAFILSLSMVVVKLIGAIYKVSLTNLYSLFGDAYASVGAGIFNNAYELYIPLFTLASAGFPIAVSRLVSENTAQGRYNDVKQIHKVSKPFFIVTGFVCFLIMVFGSYIYIDLINSPYSFYPVLCLAPTIFFGCLVSIYRGYFEGLRNMVPTAVSEIIEALSKLVIGLFGFYIVTTTGLDEYKASGTIFGLTFETESDAMYTLISFSVSAAIIGITIGSALAFLYLFLRYKIKGDGIPKAYYSQSVEARSKKETFQKLLRTAIPIGLASLVMSLTAFVDSIIIQNLLYNTAVENREAFLAQFNGLMDSKLPADAVLPGGDTTKITIHTSLWGIYSSALTIIQLVTAVTQVFGTSAMPNVTNAYTKGNRKELKVSIETVLKLTTMFTFPAGIGIFALSEPIMGLIYADPAIISIGGNVLRVMGISVIFMACSTPLCSMLQGVGRVDLPLKLFSVGMIIKIIVNYAFVSVMEINIVGAAVGSLVAYLIICIAAMYQLVKNSGVIPNFISTIIKPLTSAAICGVVAYFSYDLLQNIINGKVATVVAVAAAALIYLISLVLLRTFSANELKFLPKGEKIVIILEKWHLIG